MTELSALAGSEGYAACDDDGGPNCRKRPSEAFSDSYYALSIPTISHSALSLYMHS